MTFISGGAHKKGEGDDDEDVGEGREEEMVHICCVCMVRHKGATFIPCGHTFIDYSSMFVKLQ